VTHDPRPRRDLLKGLISPFAAISVAKVAGSVTAVAWR